MAKRDLIVIGGSAGSFGALRKILSDLPQEFPGSVLVATHIPTNSSSSLADALASAGPLPVSQAVDGQPVERGRIYTAVPNRHLLLVDGIMRLGDGPRENMARPAIDPLFRSAALAYGPRTIGVLLSGGLNDGASGLTAIKQCGGTAVVQHPLDAESDEMPLAALEVVTPDAIARSSEIGSLVSQMVTTSAPKGTPCPESLVLEIEIAGGARLGSAMLRQIADPSSISCPDCQGVLSEVRDERPLRFRCQIGHAYTAEVLAARSDEVGEAMRIALRIMEERVTLVTRMAQDARSTSRTAVAELYEARALEYGRYARILREAATASLRDSLSNPDDNV